jgi:hypothetical protein
MEKLLRDYDGIRSWPPGAGGAFDGHNPPLFPVDEKVMITEVCPAKTEFVTFTCAFNGKEFTYDMEMVDNATAEEFARLLAKHVGKTLEEFGKFRLDC